MSLMSFYDILALSLRNLRQSKLRTALTTMGVSIGIASLAGMVSLGVGLQDQVVGRFLQAGVFDAITVVSPAALGGAPLFSKDVADCDQELEDAVGFPQIHSRRFRNWTPRP